MKRPWAAAAATSAFTGLLFVILYNVCNRVTALRSDVGVWAFEWERHWPLIRPLIVPYWSIDALFVLAPFLCTTRDELTVYRQRMVFGIVGASLGFLLIPLHFAFPRPHVEGVFAPWFAALYGFDLPFNLFPSLHITLRTLLTVLYLRKCGPILRWPVHLWFSAVGFSTLFTWQHHLVDVLGGFWLAAITLHLYPFDTPPAPRSGHRTIAICYAFLAVACSQIARLAWPWTFVFVWPTFAFGVGAFGYAGFGAGIYHKRAGLLTRRTKILLGPLLAAQWLSWIYYRRKSPRWNEVTPQVWVGALPTEEDARAAIAAGVTAVLDLTVEFSETAAFRQIRYHPLPVLDLTAPTPAQIQEAVEIIERESARGIVFVHCKAGYSRTAGAVGAWLLATGKAASVEEVVGRLEAVRPGIVIRPEIRAALRLRVTRR
jgi:protein-tyrosine phosphatase/membrane-associated phospholipid phosphatase